LTDPPVSSSFQATTLEQLFQCTVPLLCEHEDDKYTYWMAGTCFLASYAGMLFAVTAKHVLDNNRVDPETIRVPYNQGSRSLLQIEEFVYPVKYDTDDSDYADLAFLSVDTGSLDPSRAGGLFPLNLDNYNRRDTLSHGGILVMRGYPKCLLDIDYEASKITSRGYCVEATYQCESRSKHCGELEFKALADIEDLNGLSGSPIFQLVKVGEGRYLRNFAGMLIRGTKISGKGHFIHSSVFFCALDRIVAAKRA